MALNHRDTEITEKSELSMSENAFFKWDDLQAEVVGGYPIAAGWWSRKYEYPWAMEYALEGHAPLRVADMGCGWTPRPFKDALARICEHVYAVDGNEKVLTQPSRERMEFVVADLTERIVQIPEGSLDRVFCISVLEDVGDKVPLALWEFGKCLKPGGLCVLTFDVQYDMLKPLGQYPGVKFELFQAVAEGAGLLLRDEIDADKKDAVYNEDFNLCVFHCVLEKFNHRDGSRLYLRDTEIL